MYTHHKGNREQEPAVLRCCLLCAVFASLCICLVHHNPRPDACWKTLPERDHPVPTLQLWRQAPRRSYDK